jgi:hypothetical protein
MSFKGYITGAHQNKNGVAVGYNDGGAVIDDFLETNTTGIMPGR